MCLQVCVATSATKHVLFSLSFRCNIYSFTMVRNLQNCRHWNEVEEMNSKIHWDGLWNKRRHAVNPWFYVPWNHIFIHSSKTSTKETLCCIFLVFMFVLFAHFLDFTFKLSISWPVTVIFNWKSGKRFDFQSQFPVSCIAFTYAY